jgi:energy-coupling factor transport system ATP-binding protein
MLNEYVTYVEQNPESQLSGPTVEDELARACRMIGLKGRGIEQNVTKVLKDVGMEDAREWFIDEISTGERRRVALGLTLLGNPKMLLLDEPFSDLDDEGITATVNYLKKYRDKSLSILISSHKLDDVLRVADRIAILEKGNLRIVDTPDKVVRNTKLLSKACVKTPAIPALCLELEAAGILEFEKCPVTLEQVRELIKSTVKPK